MKICFLSDRGELLFRDPNSRQIVIGYGETEQGPPGARAPGRLFSRAGVP